MLELRSQYEIHDSFSFVALSLLCLEGYDCEFSFNVKVGEISCQCMPHNDGGVLVFICPWKKGVIGAPEGADFYVLVRRMITAVIVYHRCFAQINC